MIATSTLIHAPSQLSEARARVPRTSVTLLSLPPELIHDMLQSLSRDVTTLRAIALTCRPLLLIAREILFAAVSYNALDENVMTQYLDCIVDLRLSHQCHIPISEALHRLQPQKLPRLKTITFLGLQFWSVAMPSSSFKALSRFTSVTELTLSGMSLLGLRHVQAFVCALPNLTALNLHRITYADPSMARRFSMPFVENSDLQIRPRLSRLAFSPDSTTRATSEIAEWLAKSPSAATLETIIVPFSTRAPYYVLSRFGPSVRHLAMPIRTPESECWTLVSVLVRVPYRVLLIYFRPQQRWTTTSPLAGSRICAP